MRPPGVEGATLLGEAIFALATVGALLVIAALVTAQRPARPIPAVDGYLNRWRRLHGDVDPCGNAWLRGWLHLSYRVARPLAAIGVKPGWLTAVTVWLAAAALVPAAAGGPWLILAAWLIVLSGLGDALDGGVAVLTERTSRFGYVLDSLVDRVNELLYLAVVVVAGGPGGLAVACGALFLLHDYLRARAGNAGGGEVGTITVGERAHRVILLAVTAHAAGVLPAAGAVITAAGLWVMVAVSAAGFVQLLVGVRRRLAEVDANT